LFEADKNMNKSQSQLVKFPILTTRHLILRQLAEDDIPGLIDLRSDEQVNRYLNRPKSMTAEEANAFIKKINDGFNKGWYYWVISLKGDQKLIGTICLWNFDDANKSIEIGYELMPAFQGQGLMHEALAEVIAFATLHLKLIIAHTLSENERSKNLLERSGFTVDPVLAEKLLTEEPGNTEVVYSLLAPI